VEVHTSCGACSKAELAKSRLAPNEETVLYLTLNLANRSGHQRSSVTLKEEGGSAWIHTYEIEVFPRARFSESNDQLSWQEVEPLQEMKRDLDFEIYAKQLASIPDRVTFTTEGGATVETLKSQAIPLGDDIWVRKLTLRISQTAPEMSGPLSGSVWSFFSFEGKEKRTRLGISGYVRSLLTISPESLFFSAGDQAKVVTIRRRDGQELTLERLSRSSHEIRCAVEQTRDRSTCLIRIEQPKHTAPVWLELVLRTNHPKQRTIAIPIAGYPDRNVTNSLKGDSQ
jgi:hypothetical protein